LLQLSPQDDLTCRVALILHDIGQGPLCQTFNDVVAAVGGVHRPLERSVQVLAATRGEYLALLGRHAEEVRAAELTTERLVDKVLELLSGRNQGLRRLLFGGLGVDRIEYYMRDGRYTGVASGVIDVAHLFSGVSVRPSAPEVVFRPEALSTIEDVLLRRSVMYARVYSEPLNRRVQATMVRAILQLCRDDASRVSELQPLTDGQLWDLLLLEHSELATDVRDGRYPHEALLARGDDEQYRALFDTLKRKLESDPLLRTLEAQLSERLGVEKGAVIVEYDEPLVRNDLTGLAIDRAGGVVLLADLPYTAATEVSEKRLQLFGVYCGAGVDIATTRSRALELLR